MQKIDFKNKPNTDSPINADNLNLLQDNIEDEFDTNNLIGEIKMYPLATAPSGWLNCDGTAVSRTEYSNLFSVIGTTFGAGDGSTTFNLPNLCGKVAVGINNTDSDFDEIGKTGGEKEHTLIINEIPEHNHELGYDTGALLTAGNQRGNAGSGSTYGQGWYTRAVGGNQPHNNLQPYLVLNYIIKY